MKNDELLQLCLTKLERGDSPDCKYPDKKGEYWTRCPFHPDDHVSNFSVSVRGYKCFACGARGKLLKLAKHFGVEAPETRTDSADMAALSFTLEEYASAKRLPVDFLAGLGLETIHIKRKPALKLPYYDESGTEASVRFRFTIQKTKQDNRFRWRTGSKTMLYGLWRLQEAKAAGYVLAVEGESDCHTLWYHGIPAVGVPGATNWRKEWSDYLSGLAVYAWQEPGEAGQKFTEKLGESIPGAFVIAAPDGRKDISEAHILDDDVPALVRRLMSQARRFSDIKAEILSKEAQAAKAQAGSLLNCSVLEELGRLLPALGLVGEDKNAKLLYLALTSRLLDKPVNIVLKGPSSAGKSFTVETVLKTFPASAFYALSSMSDKALAYSQEPLSHRFLVLHEAAGLSSDFGTYLLRTLLSERCIRYETVEKGPDGLQPRLIERQGPTGVVITTTWSSLHPENETRMLSLTVQDTPRQTAAILAALADRANGKQPAEVDLSAWHGLQTWLELAGNRDVTIPFAHDLAARANAKAVRLRRDFGAILNLIRTHAILHQAQRQKDEYGRIIATLADYAAVYDLVIDAINEGARATVSKTQRETVEAVRQCLQENADKPAGLVQVAEKLGIDKSSASRRIRVAVENGYLVNQEDKKGKPARLTMGDPLPAETPVLPAPAELETVEEGLLEIEF